MLDPVVFRRKSLEKTALGLPVGTFQRRKSCHRTIQYAAEEKKAKRCGWHLPQTFVLPHLIDLAEWKNLPPRSTFERLFPQTKESEIILFVGRINWVKNLDKLIEALALVRQKRPSAMLVCVGPDNDGYKEELVERIRSRGLSPSVLFTGMLEANRSRRPMHAAMSLPSYPKKKTLESPSQKDLPVDGPLWSVRESIWQTIGHRRDPFAASTKAGRDRQGTH